MTLSKPKEMQTHIAQRITGDAHATARCHRHPVLAVLVVGAMTICAWPGLQTFAADLSVGTRSVPGTVVPSTGTTAVSDPAQPDGRCAVLRKRYAQSEACFARYRMKNRGLRPGAFQHCKQLKDPSAECGPAIVP